MTFLQELEKKRKHVIARKAEFWGKSERIYLFYDSQQVLLEDLIAVIEEELV